MLVHALNVFFPSSAEDLCKCTAATSNCEAAIPCKHVELKKLVSERLKQQQRVLEA